MTARNVPGAADLPRGGIRNTAAAHRESQHMVRSGVRGCSPYGAAAGVPPPPPRPLEQFATPVADKPKLTDFDL